MEKKLFCKKGNTNQNEKSNNWNEESAFQKWKVAMTAEKKSFFKTLKKELPDQYNSGNQIRMKRSKIK